MDTLLATKRSEKGKYGLGDFWRPHDPRCRRVDATLRNFENLDLPSAEFGKGISFTAGGIVPYITVNIRNREFWVLPRKSRRGLPVFYAAEIHQGGMVPSAASQVIAERKEAPDGWYQFESDMSLRHYLLRS